MSIEKSKTDKFREGAWIFIAKTYNITCPVSILKRYLKRLQISPSSEDYIFKGFYYSKKLHQHVCKKTKKPLSYSRAREIVLKAFETIGLPKNKFGLHSLRACSHEPGTVNYPGVMIAPGQALPRVHMMFAVPGQVHRNLITTNLSEFL